MLDIFIIPYILEHHGMKIYNSSKHFMDEKLFISNFKKHNIQINIRTDSKKQTLEN